MAARKQVLRVLVAILLVGIPSRPHRFCLEKLYSRDLLADVRNVIFAGEPVTFWDANGVPAGLLLAILLGNASFLVKQSCLDRPIDVIVKRIATR